MGDPALGTAAMQPAILNLGLAGNRCMLFAVDRRYKLAQASVMRRGLDWPERILRAGPR
jgi:hypothetical protein